MKKITRQACALLLGVLLAGCKPQQDVTTLRLAHTLDQQHVVHKAMLLMAERLEHYSNGSMQIEIYSGGQLGNERELIELLQIGSLAMTKVSASSVESFVPQMRVFSVPYIFNDNAHWLQMDKLGHTYSAYWIQNRVNSLFRWSGMNRKSSLIISGAYGFVFQGTFEVLDGFAADYGFSYGDLIANGAGITLFTTQEILFKKQIVTPKFSFWPSEYAQYRPQLLGSNFPEQVLKDYNAQTYWLSVNLSDITPKNWRIPSWICLSFGYSISEKLKSDQEYYIIQSGSETKTFEAYRRYLLSLDIDLSRIPIKKPWLKAVAKQFNYIKVPFPTIILMNGKTSFNPLYF